VKIGVLARKHRRIFLEVGFLIDEILSYYLFQPSFAEISGRLRMILLWKQHRCCPGNSDKQFSRERMVES
jgi:hypothetical protein